MAKEDSRFRGNDGVGRLVAGHVMPAKAGILFGDGPGIDNREEDSRFRGNDGVGRLVVEHVMPAEAGILFGHGPGIDNREEDSRFRGNDGVLGPVSRTGFGTSDA